MEGKEEVEEDGEEEDKRCSTADPCFNCADSLDYGVNEEENYAFPPISGFYEGATVPTGVAPPRVGDYANNAPPPPLPYNASPASTYLRSIGPNLSNAVKNNYFGHGFDGQEDVDDDERMEDRTPSPPNGVSFEDIDAYMRRGGAPPLPRPPPVSARLVSPCYSSLEDGEIATLGEEEEQGEKAEKDGATSAAENQAPLLPPSSLQPSMVKREVDVA